MVHYVIGIWTRFLDGWVVVYHSACGVDNPTTGHWTINPDLVTCETCKKAVTS